MRRAICTCSPWTACGLAIALAVAAATTAVRVTAWQDQDAGLRIVVIEGEDSVNIIGQGTAVPAVVEVRDRNDLPVSGASVVFLLGEGGTATLNAGLSQVALTTNALGQAAVTVNPIASGGVQLQVSAAFQGQTAAAAITQTNLATAAQAAAAGTTGGAGAGAGGGGGGGAGTGTATGAAAGGGTGGGLGTGGIVGAVAGGVGAAAAGVALTRDAAPAPPVAALRLTPNGVGMAGLTEYRFDASGSSDPNRDALTYAWDFGDGGRDTGVIVRHVFGAAGTYEVTLMVSDGSAEATTSGSVEVGRNLDGRFIGRLPVDPDDCGYWEDTYYLSMNGTEVSGRREDIHHVCWPNRITWSVTGRVESANNFVCPCEVYLRLQLSSYTVYPTPPGTETREEHGIVSEGAERIESWITFYRQ